MPKSDQIATLNNGKATKVRYSISGHSAVTDSDVQGFTSTYSGYGAVVVEFYRADTQTVVGTLYYNATSTSYGAGVYVSYYSDGAHVVMNVSGTVTLEKITTAS